MGEILGVTFVKAYSILLEVVHMWQGSLFPQFPISPFFPRKMR